MMNDDHLERKQVGAFLQGTGQKDDLAVEKTDLDGNVA